MVEDKKRLIEEYLPVEELSKYGRREKKGRAPTFEMHYWWTRKPLIVSRAAVLGSILPSNFDKKKFNKLLGLDFKESPYKYKYRNEELDLIKNNIEDGVDPSIFDPFAGAGSIPFESNRLGLDTVANDYNPVSWLLLKTTIDYPTKYGNKLKNDVREYYNEIFKELQEELGTLYPKHNGKNVLAYIYAWMVECPKCGFETPLVNNWKLVSKSRSNKYFYLQPSVVDGELTFEIRKGKEAPEGTCVQGKGKCLNPECGATIENSIIRKQIMNRENEKLLAIVTERNKGKGYEIPSEKDISAINKAKNKLDNEINNLKNQHILPTEDMPKDKRAVTASLYLEKWRRLLNPRQTLLFSYLTKLIRKKTKEAIDEHGKEYGKAIGAYLTLVLGKHLNRNCRITTWDIYGEKIVHACSNKLNAIQWDHSEINPFVNVSGSLDYSYGDVMDGVDYAIRHLNDGEVEINNESILRLNEKDSDLIITDPPYFDDAPYGELSEFFYVWESRAIGEFFEDVNENFKSYKSPKDEDISVSFQRDEEFFKRAFKKSCQKLYNMLSDDGLAVIFFAHSSIDAWDFVVNALVESKFKITATWPVHTESIGIANAGKASILSSILIVARKRKDEKSGYIEEIQDDVKEHLYERLDEFWDYGLRGADLTVASMGATLDIVTQYSDIKSYTGNVTIKNILELVQGYVSNYVLRKFMSREMNLDSQTSFYLYCRFNEMDTITSDTAILIADSLSSDLNQLEKSGIAKSKRSGKSKGIKLLTYEDREHIEVKSLIDSVHLIMRTFDKSGFSEVTKVIDNIPYSRKEIKDVLESFKALDPDDPERKISRRILERMGYSFPKEGQQELEDF